MPGFDIVLKRAAAMPRRIVLPESEDPRVLQAAVVARNEGTAIPVLLGATEKLEKLAASLKLDLANIEIIEPALFEGKDQLAENLHQLREHKGMTREKAVEALSDNLNFACMLVHDSHADGCVAGAVYSTADVVRTAMQLIGKAPSANFVSSFFCMLMDNEVHPVNDAVFFADCALVISPDADQLAEIAIQTGSSAQALLGVEPNIAMLSFSTAGSAKHSDVDKVVEATAKAKALRGDWRIIGDVQLDAAIHSEILSKKAPNMEGVSATDNPACNIFVFPSLEAGNIGYKLCERFGGCGAVGPVLQGLAKPVNDLSRGCKTRDIANILAITSNQANDRPAPDQ